LVYNIYILDFRDNLIFRLESSTDLYDFDALELNTIQLLVYKVEYTDIVIKSTPYKFSLSDLESNEDLSDIPTSKSKLIFKKLIPSTMDITKYENLSLITIDNDVRNTITKTNNVILSGDTKLYSDVSNKYFVGLKDSSSVDNKLQRDVNVYTQLGSHVMSFSDLKVSDSVFSRKTNYVTNTIDGSGNTIKTSINVKLEAIKVKKVMIL